MRAADAQEELQDACECASGRRFGYCSHCRQGRASFMPDLWSLRRSSVTSVCADPDITCTSSLVQINAQPTSSSRRDTRPHRLPTIPLYDEPSPCRGLHPADDLPLHRKLSRASACISGSSTATQTYRIADPHAKASCLPLTRLAFAGRAVAATASIHGAAGFEAAAPAGDPRFTAGGGALGAVAALMRALCAAGGMRHAGVTWLETDPLNQPVETLLQVSHNYHSDPQTNSASDYSLSSCGELKRQHRKSRHVRSSSLFSPLPTP